jgi:hypothetical protein
LSAASAGPRDKKTIAETAVCEDLCTIRPLRCGDVSVIFADCLVGAHGGQGRRANEECGDHQFCAVRPTASLIIGRIHRALLMSHRLRRLDTDLRQFLVMRLYWPKTEAPSILPPGAIKKAAVNFGLTAASRKSLGGNLFF